MAQERMMDHRGPAGSRWRAAVLALAIAGAGGVAVAVRAQEVIDRVLAVVSGTVITFSDARMAAELGFVDVREARDPIATALAWLIERRLVLDEATRLEPVAADPASVELALAVVRGRFASEAAWRQALERLGVSEAAVRTFVGETLFAEAYVTRRFGTQVVPSEDELRAYYARYPERFTVEGRLLSFDEARPSVEALAGRERRATAIADWLGRLRRRADVWELYVGRR